MAQKRIKSSRFPGVYWRESSKKRFNGRPDRCFDFYLKIHGKLRWFTVGWLSDGITEQITAQERLACQNKLKEAKEAVGTSMLERFPSTAPVVSPTPCVTLNEAADLYIEWLDVESKYAGNERQRYDSTFRKTLGTMPLSDIKAAHVQQLKGKLLKRLSPGSVLRLLSTCRAIVNYAIKQEIWTGINPFGRDRLTMPRPQNKGERFLLPEEAKLLLQTLQTRSPVLHDMAWLSLKTGLRSTEIFRLQGADVDFSAGVLWITEKGGERTAMHVSKHILQKLASYGRKPSEYIFQDRRGEKITHISDTFARVCVELGWNPATPQEKARMDPRKRVWFHTLRHTFASWLAQSGKVTLYELRDLMRHKSISMTERYAHLIPAQTFKKASIIDSIMKDD